MNEMAHFEISPGTIRITECEHCGNDAFTFDTVALNDTGDTWTVSPVGTIAKCYNCEGADHG